MTTSLRFEASIQGVLNSPAPELTPELSWILSGRALGPITNIQELLGPDFKNWWAFTEDHPLSFPKFRLWHRYSSEDEPQTTKYGFRWRAAHNVPSHPFTVKPLLSNQDRSLCKVHTERHIPYLACEAERRDTHVRVVPQLDDLGRSGLGEASDSLSTTVAQTRIRHSTHHGRGKLLLNVGYS